MILHGCGALVLHLAHSACKMAAMRQTRTHPVEQINALLQERGMTRTELARRLGWERMRVVRRLTLGSEYTTELTVTELTEIAAALGVPIGQLLPVEPAGGRP